MNFPSGNLTVLGHDVWQYSIVPANYSWQGDKAAAAWGPAALLQCYSCMFMPQERSAAPPKPLLCQVLCKKGVAGVSLLKGHRAQLPRSSCLFRRWSTLSFTNHWCWHTGKYMCLPYIFLHLGNGLQYLGLSLSKKTLEMPTFRDNQRYENMEKTGALYGAPVAQRK